MQNKNRVFLTLAIILVVILILFFVFIKEDKTSANVANNSAGNLSNIEISAQNLDIPWEIEFLPSGEMLITERSGNLLRLGRNREVIRVEGVRHQGEGGLLGLALHPNFAQNNFIYLYLTSDVNGRVENRVERYSINLEDNAIS